MIPTKPKSGETYQNIFTGVQVRVVTTYLQEVEYTRDPVRIYATDYPFRETRISSFIKPEHIFMACYTKL